MCQRKGRGETLPCHLELSVWETRSMWPERVLKVVCALLNTLFGSVLNLSQWGSVTFVCVCVCVCVGVGRCGCRCVSVCEWVGGAYVLFQFGPLGVLHIDLN
jgi:hypothetical protein